MSERRRGGARASARTVSLAGLLVLASLASAGVAAAQETFTLDLGTRRAEIPTRRLGALRYVALDDLARGFGGRLEWLEVGERAALTVLDQRLVFRRDLPFVEARGSLHQIPHAPRFEAGDLYVPFSFIQQGLPAIFPERFDFEAETSSLRSGPPGEPRSIEYLVAPGLTTLRFFFSGMPARIEADASLPHALVLRVEGPAPDASAAKAVAGLGLLDSLRVEPEARGARRLVFFLDEEAFLYQVARLAEPAGFEVTLYSPAAGVDAEAVLARSTPPAPRGDPPPALATAPPPSADEAAEAGTPPPAAGPETSPLPEAETPRARRSRPRAGIRTVVIDAGHGGRDTGAIGPTGLYEKDVTLAVAHALATELQGRSDLRVLLTRERDVFVPLTSRTRMANAEGADLFVSIHCNSAR
ncbi:MAG: N-acetylmuramoyl-L-alanine amidase, partial [Gemmatimonadota bacterium]